MTRSHAIGFFLVAFGICGFSFAQTANTVYHSNGSQTSPPSSADSNADGWPDNPFAVLDDGDLWVSIGSPRTVVALRWSGETDNQTIDINVPRAGSPDQRILIEASGSLAETGEIAILLIGVAPDLESLLGNEAAGIAAHDGASLISGGQYIEISVLVSDDGGATFDELDPARLQDAPIQLRMENLTAPVDAFPVLYEHPTFVDSDPPSGIRLLAETATWTPAPCVTLPHDERAPEDTAYPAYIEAELRSLSVFAPLDDTTDSTNTLTGDEVENETTGTTGGTEIGEITLDGETLTGETTLLESGGTLLDDPHGGEQPLMLLGSGDPVWVDFGQSGYEDGTQQNPFNRFLEGLYVAALNGSDKVMIDRQTPIYRSGESGTYSLPNPVTVEAVNGPVRIGEATAILFMDFTGIGAVVLEPIGESLSGLSYALNPEIRTFPEGTAITVKAYAAEGYKFDGWWFPEDPRQEKDPDDLLVAAIHSFTLEDDRLLWAVFTKNETSLDVADWDEDGLANYREAELGTNPNNADSDGDSLPDWWEVNYGLDPLNALGDSGENGNPDEDAWVNSMEFGFAFSPVNSEAAEAEPLVWIAPIWARRLPSGFEWIEQIGPLTANKIELQTPPVRLGGFSSVVAAGYLPGTSATWRFTPEYLTVLAWEIYEWSPTEGLGRKYDLGSGHTKTFIANPSYYFENPSNLDGFRLKIVTQPTTPSDATLTGIEVTAPGTYGNMFFDGGYTWWGRPDGTPLQRATDAAAVGPERQPYPRAAEVYFNLDEVREQTEAGDAWKPFTVNLEAELDTSFSEENFDVYWSYEQDSINEGSLIGDGLSASLEFNANNPPVPGLYKIRCEVRVDGETSAPPSRQAVAYILLPFAGPDIEDWLINEARQITQGVDSQDSVAEQWVEHVFDDAEIWHITIPGLGVQAFDPKLKLLRSFMGISADYFDYINITYLSGERPEDIGDLLPTPTYNYNNGDSPNPNGTGFDDPASATLDGIVVSRGRINVVLWAVFAKAFFDASNYGYSDMQEDLAIFAGGIYNEWKVKRQIDDPSAAYLGMNLYYAIVDGKSDEWIKENVLTVNAARSIQTKNDDTIWDEELWPRMDFTAPINEFRWISGTDPIASGRNDLRTFIRPLIFRTFEEMDYWQQP